jgi:phage baseplate assembly protein W
MIRSKVNQNILGNGIRFPLRRVGSDFQESSGDDLVFSSLPHILETQANSPGAQGEIPWDSEYGTQLQRLKFENIVNDPEALNELARYYIIEGLTINEPRLLVTGTRVEPITKEGRTSLDIHVGVSTIDEDVEGNDVRILGSAVIAINFPI